jgi:hypothetical protein
LTLSPTTAGQFDYGLPREAPRTGGQFASELCAWLLFFIVLADEWPDEIENGAEDVLRGSEKRSLPDSFAVGAELFVEAVDVYDRPVRRSLMKES